MHLVKKKKIKKITRSMKHLLLFLFLFETRTNLTRSSKGAPRVFFRLRKYSTRSLNYFIDRISQG